MYGITDQPKNAPKIPNNNIIFYFIFHLRCPQWAHFSIMYDKLKSVMTQIHPISESDWAFAVPYFKYEEVKKGAVLLKEGQVCNTTYFVVAGALRIYQFNGQKETIRNIFLENSLFTESASAYTRRPSEYSIDALEDSKLLTISYQDSELVFTHSIALATLARRIIQNVLATIIDRNNEVLNLDGKARYRKLLKEKPHIFQRVPQYMIASYLGLTPEALSRIRKEIME
jgi:CRP/FNR family transcriptional regulator, anaerobic regulatory protein